MGYSSRSLLPTSRMMASCEPSGDQSACRTASWISRGAPPSSGMRASVPEETEPHVLCANQHGEFTLGRDCEQLHSRWAERFRLGIVGAHRENLRRVSRCRGAVHHGVFPREGSLENGFAPEI